jgi:hypothetical protein
VSLAHGGVAPHIIIRSSRLRLGEFEAPAAKDFCNTIGTFETCRPALKMSVYQGQTGSGWPTVKMTRLTNRTIFPQVLDRRLTALCLASNRSSPAQWRRHNDGQKSSEIAGYSSDGSIMANSEPGFFRVELLHHFVGL